MASTTIIGIVLLVIGALVTISEIHTLTIYLIAIALACFAGSGASLAGASATTSLTIVAAVIVLGMPIAHWARRKLKNRASDEVSQDDVGHTVTVLARDADGLRVSYRGSAWSARLGGPVTTTPQAGETFRIVAREGNTLVLGPHTPA